jgi:hypothetical protein
MNIFLTTVLIFRISSHLCLPAFEDINLSCIFSHSHSGNHTFLINNDAQLTTHGVIPNNSLSPLCHCAIVPLRLLNYPQKLLGQRDIKKILLRDIVKVENGMYRIEEFGILPTFDKEYEVKVTATAPVKLISRDNFLRQ